MSKRRAHDQHELVETYAADARLALGDIERKLNSLGLSTMEGREKKIDLIANNIAVLLSDEIESFQPRRVRDLVRGLLDFESFFVQPKVDVAQQRTNEEWVDLLDELNRQLENVDGIWRFLEDFSNAIAVFLTLSDKLFLLETSDGPVEYRSVDGETEIFENAAEVLQSIHRFFSSEDIDCYFLFTKLTDKLWRNRVVSSGGNPDSSNPVPSGILSPILCKEHSVEHIIQLFYSETPLEAYLVDGLRRI